MALINGVSQIAPFDPAAKQALLEADTLRERCELLIQLMQFFGRHDGVEDRVTLQEIVSRAHPGVFCLASSAGGRIRGLGYSRSRRSLRARGRACGSLVANRDFAR